MKIISSHIAKTINIWRLLGMICTEKIGSSMKLDVEDLETDCEKIVSCLKEELGIEHLVEDINSIIKYGDITYSEKIDKICFIVDRDKKSFISKTNNNQYKYVLYKCKEKRFGLYLTNPCFEFWLLMHFDEVKKLDKEKLLENSAVSARRKYAEQELRNVFIGYEKSNYDAEFLVRNVEKAIKNEALFCEDIEKLEYEIGSNVGLLIKELQSEIEDDIE